MPHDRLRAAGVEPEHLRGIVLTHAHWDHASGLDDMRGVRVLLPSAELDFVRSKDRATELIRGFGELNYEVYDFPNGAHLGFDASQDMLSVRT